MSARDLVLNIAVNLGRLSRFSSEGRAKRIKQFLTDTEYYLAELEKIAVSDKFRPTLERFKLDLIRLKDLNFITPEWAEETLTWANILQHRAKLA